MIIQGPSAANVGPPAPPAPPVINVAQPVVYSITFDMVAHTFTITYGVNGPTRTLTGNISTGSAVYTALETHALRAIEVDQGWAASSSSVVAP